MPPLQPEQALFLRQMSANGFKTEQATTRRVIAAIPLDKGDYRPDEIAKSAMDLAWHIVVTEERFLNAVIAGEFDLAPKPRPETLRNSADLVAWYDRMVAEKMPLIEQLSGEQLAKVVDFRGMFQLPAVFYLQFVVGHTIHHRGQLSMYLRPMGAKVPAIYGESYDTALAKKA